MFFSQKFTHAGQQEVKSGISSVPPFASFSRNSADSSSTVRSAPVEVSKTSLKPMRRSAATMRPIAFSPPPMPNSSPIATRTAGAIWTETRAFLSSSAFQTFAVSFLTTIAPVGQTAAHWPQPTQLLSAIGMSKTVLIVIFEPRRAKSIAPTLCISLHILTQSPQRMHLLWSRDMQSDESSRRGSAAPFGKRTPSMLKRIARSWSLHLPLLWQVVQSRQWSASSSSSIILRYLRSRSVFVHISMPSFGGVEQAASRPPHLFSTMHMRHAP